MTRAGRRAAGLALGTWLIAAACASHDPTAPDVTTDPAAAEIVTSDLVHFWAAYDAGGKDGIASAFQQRYLDSASSGLRDFIGLRAVTAASLVQMVRAYPRYFAAIRANSLRLATDGQVAGRIRANYARIQALYPAAVFPPVTLLIGRFNTGGTTSPHVILIGSEFYALTPDVPTDELGLFQRDNVRPADSLPVIVAHEHVHILQARAAALRTHPNTTLLEQALLEGSADFVGELSSGGSINARLWAYAVPREAALWAEFQAAMHGTDVSRWLYNQGVANAGVPGDLGYFIGYRIAEAYYTRAADKVAALRAIIEVQDADALLAASGYAP